jgi:hypothetical protein
MRRGILLLNPSGRWSILPSQEQAKNFGIFAIFRKKIFDELLASLYLNFDSHHYARLNKEVPSSTGVLPRELTSATSHHYARLNEQVPIPIIFLLFLWPDDCNHMDGRFDGRNANPIFLNSKS